MMDYNYLGGTHMIRGIDSILLFAVNAKKLAVFYREKVGINVKLMGVLDGKDEAYNAHWKQGSDLAIIDHSEVKGKNKQPERYMVNFEVDDIEKEVARMKKEKIKLITDIYHVEDYGQIATFEDIEGNYFQFVQVRPNKK